MGERERKISTYQNPNFMGDDGDIEEWGTVDGYRDIELYPTCNGKGLEEKASMDFNDMLPLIGEFGRYQKFLFILMIPFAYYLAFVYFTQIFLTLMPEEHWCTVPELGNLTREESLKLSIPLVEGKYSKCLRYDVNFTEQLLLGVTEANSSWPVTTCSHGWTYDFNEIPYTTIATEQNWVCDNAVLATYAQSIFFVGAICGGLLFGWVADKFGRVPSMIACNLVGCAAGVTTAFVNTFWLFALMRFLVGFAFDNCFVMMFILALEYVGPKYRTFVANMPIAIYFTSATCILPWIAYYIANWKYLAIATSAPLILVVFAPWLVPESARWLVSQGKIDKSIEILKTLARRNRSQVSDETFEEFRLSCQKLQQEEQQNTSYSIMDMFRTPRLRRTTILLVIVWMCISLVFDGHVRSVGSLPLNIFLTFTLACLTECPAGVILLWTMDRLGRRWNACGSMVLSGLFSLLAAMAPSGVYTVAFAIAGRFFVNISYNVGSQYAAEVLPTVVRAQGVAFIHIMGYVSTILAPFVVYLSNIATVLPLIILGCLGIVGGLLCLLLPETVDRVLPQTLQDGEEFGKNQRMWEMPCLDKKPKEDCD
ncbi:organic cation transporter protein [Musca domestica]|uniref:Organic cation transporter protein n=1 Tax=Musca domestica TaxID=7370 RepID=T1PHJ0_MUSDO|nr:organic cation transporter protein [Musca domestica]